MTRKDYTEKVKEYEQNQLNAKQITEELLIGSPFKIKGTGRCSAFHDDTLTVPRDVLVALLGKDKLRLIEALNLLNRDMYIFEEQRIDLLRQQIDTELFDLKLITCPLIKDRPYCTNQANLNELSFWLGDVARNPAHMNVTPMTHSELETLYKEMQRKGWVFDLGICKLCLLGANQKILCRAHFSDDAPTGVLSQKARRAVKGA